MLIVFEGIDGAGKNTQIKKLSTYFKQNHIPYKIHKYPTSNAMDAHKHLKGLANYDAKKLAEIFADDIMNDMATITDEISQGYVVICDRYLHSTLAYQGVNLDFEKLSYYLEKKGAIIPDLVILLDIEPRKGADRKKDQKELDRFENDQAYLAEVRKNYHLIMDRHFLSYRYVKINSSNEIDFVFSEIIVQVEPILTRKKVSPKYG